MQAKADNAIDQLPHKLYTVQQKCSINANLTEFSHVTITAELYAMRGTIMNKVKKNFGLEKSNGQLFLDQFNRLHILGLWTRYPVYQPTKPRTAA